MYALRHCLCSYILNFSNGEKVTDEKKCVSIFGLCGRGGFVPRPKPAQNVRARLAFQSFPVTSPMCTVCWARNSVRCKEVVSLLFDKFSLTVSISGTLKLH